MIERLAPNRVLAAYKRLGIVPQLGGFGNISESCSCVCPLVVMYFDSFPDHQLEDAKASLHGYLDNKHFQIVLDRLGLTVKQAWAFIRGVDGWAATPNDQQEIEYRETALAVRAAILAEYPSP